MARYEVALDTPLAFSSSTATNPFVIDDQSIIEFEGRRFTWHSGREHDGERCLPVVTVILEDADDYAAERLLTNRLLSALSYVEDCPISITASAATGYLGEADRPILCQPGQRSVVVKTPVAALTVCQDDRLRLVLALFREGRSANSPFYRFLALYNALDAAFDDDPPALDGFVRDRLASGPPPASERGTFADWAGYLRDALRHAIAHAVRWEGKPVLNPDDLADRSELDQASTVVTGLLHQRVDERWPGGVRAERDWTRFGGETDGRSGPWRGLPGRSGDSTMRKEA